MAQDGRSWLGNTGAPQPGGNVDGSVGFPAEWAVIQKDPGATVSKGDVLDTLEPAKIFIALADGVSGETIPMATRGIHEIAKVDAAVIAAGEQVLWDTSANEVDDDAATPATGDFLCGQAMESKGATTSETIAVLINTGANATVT